MALPSPRTRNPLKSESSSSFPIPTDCCSPSLSFPPSSSPSIYVTFKVLQLVKRIQRRVHARASKTVTPAKARQAFCQDFEHQAIEEIDRYLGRKTIYPPRRTARKSLANHDLYHSSGRSIEWLLNEIDQSVTSNSHKLDIVAKDNKLFLNHAVDIQIKSLSLKHLIELLVTVKDLLASLKQKQPHSRVKTVCEGNEVLSCDLDETYIANLEHLLLCLHDQLIRILIANCVDLVHKHLVESQKDQNKRCEEWFFEFPDSRHPLSTTWPWSIRPSLAVIWGVCWMFEALANFTNFANLENLEIDAYGNMVDVQGHVILTAQEVHEISATMNNIHSECDPFAIEVGAELREKRREADCGAAGLSQDAGVAGNSRGPGQSRRANPSPELYSLPTSGSHRLRGHEVTAHPPHIRHQAAQAAPSRRGLEFTNNASPAVAPGQYSGGVSIRASNQWLAAAQAETSVQAQPGFHHDNSAPTTPYGPADYYDSSTQENYSAWPPPQQQPPHSSATAQLQTGFQYSHPALPHGRALTPTIRVITDVSGSHNFQQTPQDPNYHSAISSASSVPLYEDTPSYPTYSAPQPNLQGMATLHDVLATQQSLGPHEGVQNVPVSPISSDSRSNVQQLGEAMSRKRSHSQMSQGDHFHPEHHMREPSLGAPQMDATSSGPDETSPRGSHSFKRGDPPLNQQNKYICNFSTDCDGQTFDRKCEWSKHMDKHDRPYRCQHQDCGKLQGFTYSGGLLRHEREVHGKHGGPKSQLMCPFEDCKRHTGKGFTRKENLNEHVRRVHDSKYNPLPNATGPPIPGFEQLDDTPVSRISDHQTPVIDEILGEVLGKRKHSEVEDFEEIRQEMKRLREDNEAKAERMRMMEAQEAHRVLEMEQLREELRILQHGQQIPQKYE